MPTYSVKQGDTLSGIAKNLLGSESRYRELKGYTGDPTRLPVGTTLTYGTETPASAPAPDGKSTFDFSGLAGTGASAVVPPAAPPVKSSDVSTPEDANAYINAEQDTVIASADEIPVRGGVDTTEKITETVKAAVTPETAAPAAPNYAKTYTDLREAQGVAGLEDGLNSLTAQEDELKAALRQFADQQAGLPIAQRVAEGRVSEAEKRINTELDRITREKSVITNQLKTKYGAIELMMNFAQLDYETAKGRYDSDFNKNIQTFNLVKGIEENQKSDAEKTKDNARANLQIISNALKDSNLAELTEAQKLTIRGLELQAGLPAGTIEKFKNNNPKADIITSNEWTDASGKQYIAIVSKGEDGKLKTENVYLGQGKVTGSGGGSGNPTEAETKLYFKQSMAGQLKNVVGGDGYVSQENWRKARKAWTDNTPYTGKDFDDNFRSYVNPAYAGEYEGFEEFGPGFTKAY